MEEARRTMESVSDDILQKAQTDVAELLRDKKLSKTDRTQLEVQSYFLMFLVNDHKKINKMYPFFEEQQKRYERRKVWWDKLQWVITPTDRDWETFY